MNRNKELNKNLNELLFYLKKYDLINTLQKMAEKKGGKP